jgi:hypothetical protein
MESGSTAKARRGVAQVAVSGPDGTRLVTVELAGERVSVGRFRDANDIALQPDPELLVTRAGHFTFERAGARWFVRDGGGVNGTFIRRGGSVHRVTERMALHDGDVVCVLGSISESHERRFFELVFHATAESQATRAAEPAVGCLDYDVEEARLVLVHVGERHEISIRAQAHRLVRYMVERNAAAGGVPTLCTHDELMHAVWADEALHSRVELAKLVWELRKKLAPFGAEQLIENERRLGYRLRTCGE